MRSSVGSKRADRSNFAWTDVTREQDGSILAVAGFEAWAVVQRHGEHWAAIGGVQKDGERSTQVVAIGDRSVCLARADDWMNANESAHRTRRWTRPGGGSFSRV